MPEGLRFNSVLGLRSIIFKKSPDYLDSIQRVNTARIAEQVLSYLTDVHPNRPFNLDVVCGAVNQIDPSLNSLISDILVELGFIKREPEVQQLLNCRLTEPAQEKLKSIF